MPILNRQRASGSGGVAGFSGAAIDDSCIFNDGDSPNLSLTFGTGDRRQGSFGCWLKRGVLSTVQVLFNAGAGVEIAFNAANQLYFAAGAASLITTQLFRDPTAWYHILYTWDTDQATAADRVTLYINGVEVTDFGTATYPVLNVDLGFYNAVAHHIGSNEGGTEEFDGYLTAIVGDNSGVEPAVSDFGALDAYGNWGPASAASIQALDFGTEGFFLEDGTAIQAGTDSSGGSNDWTVANLASTDIVPDSPTNNEDGTVGNYATFNPINDRATVTASEGNLTVLTNASAYGPIASTIAVPADSSTIFRAQFTCDADSSGDFYLIGVIKTTDPMNSATAELGNSANGYGLWGPDGTIRNNAGYTAYDSAYTTGDVIDVFLGNGCLFYAKNGTLLNSATQSEVEAGTTTNAAASGLTGDFYFACGDYSGAQTVTVSANFGQKAWANEYASITDVGINSKTWADATAPTIDDPTDDFVTVVDTETNILATLATARTGWSDYVDILLNRTNNEVRRWRFSHDSSNEHAQTTTSTYQASASLSGSDSWLGMSLKVDGTSNVRAGSVSHTNGADTTVTFTDVGTARYLCLLFRRDSAVEVPMQHPDLTTGSLLFLTSIAAEAVDADIKTFTSSSFKIDTGEATDTYDYLVIPESDGFVFLGHHTGNSIDDGPVSFAGFSPAIWWKKSNFSSADHYFNAFDLQGYGSLLTEKFTLSDGTASNTGATHEMEFLATGAKQRANEAASNGAGIYVDFAIAGAPLGGTLLSTQQSRLR
jgi:hypothetical protein